MRTHHGISLFIGLACFYPNKSDSQWQMVLGPFQNSWFYALAYDSTYVFAGAGEQYPGRNRWGVWRSSDRGTTWVRTVNGFLNDDFVYCFTTHGSTVYCGSQDGMEPQVYRSTSHGDSWTRVNTGLGSSDGTVNALASKGTLLFCGTYYGGVYRSTNDGNNWAQANTGLSSLLIRDFLVDTAQIFVATEGGVFKSTNDGDTWSPSGIGAISTRSLARYGTHLFAATWGSGVFRSTNDGADWVPVNSGLTETRLFEVYCADSLVLVGCGFYGGVFVSTNEGSSWIPAQSGMGRNWVRSFIRVDTVVFAATWDAVWRRLATTITAVKGTAGQIPTGYSLSPNYPNPFNPTTTISYEIPEQAHVKLRIYDLLGRQIETLADETKQAGRHEVSWDASGMASGLYFCRFQAGAFSDIKKLILLK